MIPLVLWPSITLQIVMGAFDTLYHHEMTERLAWRPAQCRELRLHGIRNLLYAALFLMLGWREPHGVPAMLVIAVLALELIITLMDFVEEDLTRKLPASERINHTLLALNYGAILALLLPPLLAWAARPTALVPADYGGWSMIASIAAAGIAVFGLRDLTAAHRVRRLAPAKAGELMAALPAPKAVLVTGATGFVGRRLVAALAAAGHQPIALVRDPHQAAALPPPLRLVTRLDQIPADSRIDAIVNLAGEPIAGGFWTAARRRRILASRLRVTRDVVRLIERLERKPTVLVSASAIGWYGLWQDEALTEFDGGKACFTHRVCEAWERAAVAAERLGVRVVRLRIGLVLGTEGGLLARLLMPFELGLGGPIGDGRQWMSWIARDDLVRLMAHVIATPSLSGPVNATAPEPVTNRAFAHALAHVLRRPALLRVPAVLLRALGGDLARELMLGGQRVLPDKAEASGFTFRHPTLHHALSAMLGMPPSHPGHAGGRAAGARKPRYFGGRARARGLSLRAGWAELAARHRLSDDRLLR
ncbi:MAG TPA: TIGR01777 family oxidoreductase [Xanthobacteraceae bacterium]|nr:TIGR01777 family oxidoreductase [Xanthobacteraceae bacterium]